MLHDIDPILLGDNPFMGVDHLSQERARLRGIATANHVVDILEFAYEHGVKGFVASTHPQLKGIIEYMNEYTVLSKKISFYPILPYAYGYVRQMTENGIVSTISNTLSPASTQDKVKIIFSGGMSMLKKDMTGLLRTFIDVELLPLSSLNLKCIFLHDVLTDLALSLKLKTIFDVFIKHINDKYNTRVGFVTKNFSRLIDQFDEWNYKNLVIMTPFNKVGFQMNPSKEACEEALQHCNHDVIAMSILAAGYLKPDEACEYLFKLPNITSTVVGVSSKKHGEETFKIIREYMNKRM